MHHSLLIVSLHPWRIVIPLSLTVTPAMLNVASQPMSHNSQISVRLFRGVGNLYAILTAEGIPSNSNCSVLLVCIVCLLGTVSVFMGCLMLLYMAGMVGIKSNREATESSNAVESKSS